MPNRQDSRNNFLAGSIAGSAAVVFLHPFDVVKTRLQVQDGYSQLLYKGTRDAIGSIWRQEGWAGFYRGLTPALVGSAVAWGTYFYLFDTIKRHNMRWQEGGKEGEKRSSAMWNLISAAEAGGLVCLLTNPIWLIKTRLQLQQGALHPPRSLTAPSAGAAEYRGMMDAFRRIAREEGFRGLYKGLGPSLLLQSTHGAVQQTIYEELKHVLIMWKRSRRESATGGEEGAESGKGEQLHSLEVSFCASSAKLAASVTTYPFQVMRSRLQQRLQGRALVYTSTLDVFRKTAAREGIRGFYKGLLPNLLRTMPQSALTYVVYEKVLHFLDNHFPSQPPASPSPSSDSKADK